MKYKIVSIPLRYGTTVTKEGAKAFYSHVSHRCMDVR